MDQRYQTKCSVPRSTFVKDLTCFLCKGLYREAHTLNECMCTFCKICAFEYFSVKENSRKCPKCCQEIRGRVFEQIVKDNTMQTVTDLIFPEFKQREDALRAKLLEEFNQRRIKSQQNQQIMQNAGNSDQKNSSTSHIANFSQVMKSDSSTTSSSHITHTEVQPQLQIDEINFEFKLLPFNDDDQHLVLEKLPKTLKYSNKNKNMLTLKKHIHMYLGEPVDNIEILCKNFPCADSHSLEYVKKTKWQSSMKVMELMYKRKTRPAGIKDEFAASKKYKFEVDEIEI
eukprot:403365953